MGNTNDKCIFWASFMTLIAAGIGFSVRGAIMGDWGRQFGFTQSELGGIVGGGLTGFGITIILFSFVADKVGYGKLMILAFLLHASSAVVTFAATPIFEAGGIFGMDARTSAFWCLNIGMWLFALGNGTCEAVINPLTATLFPNNKTHWLNILHAGWPGGLVLGALITVGFNLFATPEAPIRWEIKLGVFVIPVLIYGLLMLGRTFPKSEATASGVSLGTMILALLSPILILLWFLHGMVGYVELGTDSWITNITTTVLKNENLALGAFIWTNVLMFTLRFFAGPIVHKISPLGLLFFSAVLGTAGLVLMGMPFTNNVAVWIGVVTIYGIGKTFYWPTMLGVISERFPKAGALALGISGGVGMICAGLFGGPGIGYKQDYFATSKLKETSAPAYERYRSDKPNDFPYISELVRMTSGTDHLPKIAGLDNSKVGVLLDDAKKLETDLGNIKAKGETNESLNKLQSWWGSTGKLSAEDDKPKVVEATLFGGKQAMLYTAVAPAAMAIGYLLLILLFKAMGGYKQVHLGEAPPGH